MLIYLKYYPERICLHLGIRRYLPDFFFIIEVQNTHTNKAVEEKVKNFSDKKDPIDCLIRRSNEMLIVYMVMLVHKRH
jgi:hypothetical protein